MNPGAPGETGTAALDACADCDLRVSGDGHCCGGAHGARTTGERAVLLAAGLAALLLALATLTVDASFWVAIPASATSLGGLVLAATGLRALPGVHPRTSRDVALGLRILPLTVAGLLLTLVIALVRTAS